MELGFGSRTETQSVTLPSPDGPYVTRAYTERLNVTKRQAKAKVCSENFYQTASLFIN